MKTDKQNPLFQTPFTLNVPPPESLGNVFEITGKPYGWQKYHREKGRVVASVVFASRNNGAALCHYPREIAEAHAKLLLASPRLLEVLAKAERFVSAFEGDEMLPGIGELLKEMRETVRDAGGA